MGKYKNEVSLLLSAIGGKENIDNVQHCVTRMRFKLVNNEIVDIKTIGDMPFVKGVVSQSGQFQVIIGNGVKQFYEEFIELMDGKKEKEPWSIKKSFSNIGDVFAPIIPAIISAGIIFGLKNICQINNFNSLVPLFDLMATTVFYFMPVAIVWSIAKKMKATEIMAIAIGLTLVVPSLMVFDGVQGFANSILPAFFVGFAFVYIERFFKWLSPESLTMLIVPLFTFVITVSLSQLLLAPMGLWIDIQMAKILIHLFTSPLRMMIALIIGVGYMPLVLTGMHHIVTLFDLQMIISIGGTLLWPLLALANIAQGASTLGMVWLQRKDKKLKENNISAAISCFVGVSEPALFGVNLKYKFPFICGLIGSGIACVYVSMNNVMATSIGIGGLPAILSILPKYMISYLLAIIIAIGIPFILTIVVGKIKLKQSKALFVSPMTGTIMKLEEVEDQVFSQKMMGDGFAIVLESNQVVSPVDGEIIMTFPTHHAYGIKSVDGFEILIHIGMDTVQLNGVGFNPKVKQKDRVKQGELLVEVDIDYIKSQGKSLVTPIVFTSQERIEVKKEKVNIGDLNIIEIKE